MPLPFAPAGAIMQVCKRKKQESWFIDQGQTGTTPQ
jgi:hypothetical protein